MTHNQLAGDTIIQVLKKRGDTTREAANLVWIRRVQAAFVDHLYTTGNFVITLTSARARKCITNIGKLDATTTAANQIQNVVQGSTKLLLAARLDRTEILSSRQLQAKSNGKE